MPATQSSNNLRRYGVLIQLTLHFAFSKQSVFDILTYYKAELKKALPTGGPKGGSIVYRREIFPFHLIHHLTGQSLIGNNSKITQKNYRVVCILNLPKPSMGNSLRN